MQLSESQVNASRLADIFANAFIEVSDLTENSFMVKPENAKILVEVDVDKKAIVISAFQTLKDISLQEAAMITSQLNTNYIMVRFYVMEVEGRILLGMDHRMTYERGLIAFHLVSNVKWFEKIAFQGIVDSLRDNCE